MSKVLVIAPHADDEILGCGGAMFKHSEQGAVVVVAVLTNASLGAPELFSPESIQTVRDEALRAHKIVGVSQTIFEELPALMLDQVPQYKVASKIAELIQEHRPETLYIPHRGDLHVDHQVIFNGCLIAARPSPDQSVKKIFSYETLSETEWGHPTADCAFIPTKFIDISGRSFTAKMQGMSEFKSQLKPFPNSRSLQAIEHLAGFRGATVGVERAEAFVVIRCVS